MIGGLNWPVLTPPIAFPRPRLNRLMPSVSALLRSTLAMRTFSRICGSDLGTFTSSRFTTFPAVDGNFHCPRRAGQIVYRATQKNVVVAVTHPDRFDPAARSSARAGASRDSRSISWRSGRTVTLKNWRPPRMSQMIRLVSPGALPSIMISVGLTAVASAMSPNPTATRWIGCAQSTSTALPTATESSFVESSNVAPADVGVDGAA